MAPIDYSPGNLLRLAPALAIAQQHGYALGSFAPRYTAMIAPVHSSTSAFASGAAVDRLRRKRSALS